MAKTPFLGTAYTARSPDLANQRLINLYLEAAETKEGWAPGGFFSCPGLTLALKLPTQPVRAIYTRQNNIYVLSGNTLYLISTNLTVTTIGTIASSIGPAYIVYNGTQVGVFDAGGLYVSTGNGPLTAVSLPFSNPGVPAFLDTFCLVNQVGTYNIWQSNSNDLTTWDPLNFTTEDGNSEAVVGLAALHDQIIVFKRFSLCFYVNQGNNGFVFGRLPSVYPIFGCAAAATITVLGDKVYWLGQTKTTGPRVYAMDGYQPHGISTYAIDNAIANYATVTDAFGFGYGQEGHNFYIVTFPTGGQTWVYDDRETARLRAPVWHQRASFANGQFGIYAGIAATALGNNVYMGDPNNGNLYLLDLSNFGDYGSTRKWLRSWRSLPEATEAPERVNWLDIQCETGINVPPGANPQMVLRQSFDEGSTWSAELYASAGQVGQTAASVRFNRLGATRRGLNSNRLFELSSTDSFFAALMAAETG